MPFDLVPEDVLRALRYIDLLNRNGAEPTGPQVDEFAESIGPEAVEYSPFRLTGLAQLADAFLSGMKVRDAETVSEYLSRMEWATGGAIADTSKGFVALPETGMRMTALGAAFLAGARQDQAELVEQEALPRTVVLEPQNPMSQIELAQMTSNAGAGLLLDPYLEARALPWLVTSTGITRVLIRPPRGGVGPYGIALGHTVGAERIEVRVTGSKEFHDRAIVGVDGTVTQMGTSVNSVGRHLSSLTTLSPDDGASLRARFETLYQAAERVEPVRMDGANVRGGVDGLPQPD